MPTVADRQNVWGVRYIDELIMRDDYSGPPPFHGHFYALQDANWNVVATVGADGTVKERYSYTAYGKPEFAPPISRSTLIPKLPPPTAGTPSTPAANTTPKPACNTAANVTTIW